MWVSFITAKNSTTPPLVKFLTAFSLSLFLSLVFLSLGSMGLDIWGAMVDAQGSDISEYITLSVPTSLMHNFIM